MKKNVLTILAITGTFSVCYLLYKYKRKLLKKLNFKKTMGTSSDMNSVEKENSLYKVYVNDSSVLSVVRVASGKESFHSDTSKNSDKGNLPNLGNHCLTKESVPALYSLEFEVNDDSLTESDSNLSELNMPRVNNSDFCTPTNNSSKVSDLSNCNDKPKSINYLLSQSNMDFLDSEDNSGLTFLSSPLFNIESEMSKGILSDIPTQQNGEFMVSTLENPIKQLDLEDVCYSSTLEEKLSSTSHLENNYKAKDIQNHSKLKNGEIYQLPSTLNISNSNSLDSNHVTPISEFNFAPIPELSYGNYLPDSDIYSQRNNSPDLNIYSQVDEVTNSNQISYNVGEILDTENELHESIRRSKDEKDESVVNNSKKQKRCRKNKSDINIEDNKNDPDVEDSHSLGASNISHADNFSHAELNNDIDLSKYESNSYNNSSYSTSNIVNVDTGSIGFEETSIPKSAACDRLDFEGATSIDNHKVCETTNISAVCNTNSAYSFVPEIEPPNLHSDSDQRLPDITNLPIPLYEFQIPKELAGRLIGRKGSFVNKVFEMTKVRIIVQQHETNKELCICKMQGLCGKEYDLDAALRKVRERFPSEDFPQITLENTTKVVDESELAENYPNEPYYESMSRIEISEIIVPMGVSFDISVSCMNNLSEFWIQQPNTNFFRKFLTMQQKLKVDYGDGSLIPSLPEPVMANTLAVCKVNGCWYRCAVTECANSVATVQLLDVGGTLQLPFKRLKLPCTEIFLLCCQAVLVNLYGLEPPNGSLTFSREGDMEFKNLLINSKRIEATVAAISQKKTNLLKLYSNNDGEYTYINKELVDKGFGKWADYVLENEK